MDSIGLLIVLEIGVKDVPVFGAAWPLCLPDDIFSTARETVGITVKVPLIPCHLVSFALHHECSAEAIAWFVYAVLLMVVESDRVADLMTIP